MSYVETLFFDWIEWFYSSLIGTPHIQIIEIDLENTNVRNITSRNSICPKIMI